MGHITHLSDNSHNSDYEHDSIKFKISSQLSTVDLPQNVIKSMRAEIYMKKFT